MEEEGGGSFPLTPLQGTYIIGAVNGIAATLTILIVATFGRRTILVSGQFFMGLFMILCGVSIMQEWNLASFILINLLIVSYHWSTGGVSWLYTSEVGIDAA